MGIKQQISNVPASSRARRWMFETRGLFAGLAVRRDAALSMIGRARYLFERVRFPLVGLANCAEGERPVADRRWQRERSDILEAICQRIEREAGPTRSVATLAEEMEAEFFGRCYVANGKRMRLSASTIRRCYYEWLRLGKDRAAFGLDYFRLRQFKVDESLKLAFKAAAAMPGATSFVAAYRLLLEGWQKLGGQGLRVGRDCFRRAFDAEERRELEANFERNRSVLGLKLNTPRRAARR